MDNRSDRHTEIHSTTEQNKYSFWLSVDPLAHKYLSMSPYNFTGNNPIMLVDPDGRDIWIVGDDGESFLYVPNTTYSGNDAFTQTMVDSYNEASTARDVINEMVTNNESIEVKNVTGDPNARNVYSSNVIGDYQTGTEKFVGGTISIDLNSKGIPVQTILGSISNKRVPDLTMSVNHESIHAFRQFKGKYIPGIKFGSTNIDIEELETSHLENVIRSEIKNNPRTLRTHYEVDKVTGHGTGYGLLKHKNGNVYSKYHYDSSPRQLIKY